MKTLNSMFPSTTMEQLEQQADSCWEQLHVPESVHRASEITAAMPVFIVTGKYPLLYVAYPTYKIKMLLPENKACHDKDVEVLLADISHRSRIQLEALDYAIIRNRYVPLPCPAQCCCTTCLGTTFKKNAAIRDQIINVLEQEHLQYFVLPTYQYRAAEIRFLEDGDSFIVL